MSFPGVTQCLAKVSWFPFLLIRDEVKIGWKSENLQDFEIQSEKHLPSKAFPVRLGGLQSANQLCFN